MPAEKLSIAIPTYNRADIVSDNLLRMKPALERLGIPVFILDDSSNNETEKLAAEFANTTKLRINYRRNTPTLGHDANLLAALTAPDSDYVWLLADALYVDNNGLESVSRLVAGQDFLFVNARDQSAAAGVKHIQAADIHAFMVQRTWEFTLTGATIYARRVIDWWKNGRGRKVYRNFPQLSVMLNFLAQHPDAFATWVGERIVRGTRIPKQSYWGPEAVEVFAGDWFEVISARRTFFGDGALPSVLMSHARHTGTLGAIHLFQLRAEGHFSRGQLRTHRASMRACSSAGAITLHCLAVLPSRIARWLISWRRCIDAGFLRVKRNEAHQYTPRSSKL